MLGRAFGILLCAFAFACLPGDDRDPPGRVFVTATAQETLDIPPTSDGWQLTFQRYLISLGHSSLDGDACGSYTESWAGYVRILNMLRSGPQKVGLVHGLGPCDFQFRVAHPTTQSARGEGITDADETLLRTPGLDPYGVVGGISLYVEGTARRSAVTKRFAWAFRHRNDYYECRVSDTRGVVLQQNVDVTVDLRVDGMALFKDDLSAPVRFDPFAAADDVHGNGDGDISLAELKSTPLGDIVYRDLAPRVIRFQGTGTCSIRGADDDDD